MLSKSFSITTKYKSADIYDLVLDVESYPEFIPWCSAVKILNCKDNVINAELNIKYKIFSVSYISKITYIDKKEIKVELVQGPLKSLQNNWSFAQDKNRSTIDFNINFQTKSSFFDNLIQKKIEYYTNLLMEAFVKRAGELGLDSIEET